MISVLIVNSKRLICSGLQRILEAADDLKVIGTETGSREALHAARQYRPEVAVISEDTGGTGALEITRRLTADVCSRVVGICAHSDGPFARRMLHCGARGIVTYGCSADELVRAVRYTAGNETYLAEDVLRRLAHESLQHVFADEPLSSLSNRELQVFRMIVGGHGRDSISVELCLSPKTVSTYRYRIARKLGTRNDVELVRLAMRYGILDVEAMQSAG